VTAALRRGTRAENLTRARRLAAALGFGLLASLANPSGARPHALYLIAGSETPALELVADEWAPLDLFQLPAANLPPSALTWGAVWVALFVTPCAVVLHARRPRTRVPSARGGALDPALVAVAAASLLAALSAVRLVWLTVFPLVVVARAGRSLDSLGRPERAACAWAAALATLLLVPGFVRLGDWPMISQGIHPAWYRRPYPAVKYHADAVWFLRDAQLEGALWNDYESGNFLGYWLAPRMRAFVNGSLNVPPDVMNARLAIVNRRGSGAGEGFAQLLDRHRVDVFFGTGLPVVPRPGRPVPSTTTHLENTPGWVPVFRNLRSAVYLRRGERNRANLGRVAGYYAREAVPFDPERGFDVERVLREAPRWAVDHGLVPADFQRLEGAARSSDPERRRVAQERLAAVLATLGLYERATEIDRSLLRADPRSVSAARRIVWSLLHLGRVGEGLEAAERLSAVAAADDGLSRMLVDAARWQAALSREEAAALVALLPLFTRPQLQGLLAGVREPDARPRKDDPAASAASGSPPIGDPEAARGSRRSSHAISRHGRPCASPSSSSPCSPRPASAA